MESGLQRAIARRLRAMWPISKVVADLAQSDRDRETVANAVRAWFAAPPEVAAR